MFVVVYLVVYLMGALFLVISSRCTVPGGFVVAALFLVDLWPLLCFCLCSGHYSVPCSFMVAALFLAVRGRCPVPGGVVATSLFLLVLWLLLCSLWICWHCSVLGGIVVVVLCSWWYCGSCTLLLVVLW